MKYDFKTVEAKWQKVWEDEDTFHAEIDHSKPKFYALVEFPYPSAAGLHVGHPRSYTALDIVARKKRQCGYNVLYPMGWDAFGLPTENYALKNHIFTVDRHHFHIRKVFSPGTIRLTYRLPDSDRLIQNFLGKLCLNAKIHYD